MTKNRKDKFVWGKGDIVIINKKSFEQQIIDLSYSIGLKFNSCHDALGRFCSGAGSGGSGGGVPSEG